MYLVVYFGLQFFLFNLVARKLSAVSYAYFPFKFLLCHLNGTIVSIYKTMDDILMLS